MSFDLTLSVPQRLLCDALAEHSAASCTGAVERFVYEIGDREAFVLARTNQVDSMIAHTFQSPSNTAPVSEHWLESHNEMYRRISGYLKELDDIAAHLAEAGIPLVALKNGGIARGIYPCPGCCPMGDLDVLVEKHHFRHAHQILLNQRYHFEFRSPLEQAELDAAEDSGSAEYHKQLPNGEKMWFELQWRPVAGRWIRPDQEPSAQELMGRSIPVPGTAVRLLAPEDNLLQVALHTAKHSYVRAPGFRLHLDVERIVRGYPDLDWDMFLAQVERLQVKTAVYFSLAIPKLLFQTPIPDRVLARLKPPAWKEVLLSRWLQRVGLFNPDAPKFSHPGFVVFTALLYDDLGGLWRGVFPERDWMRERYAIRNEWLVPYFHARRLFELVFKRMPV